MKKLIVVSCLVIMALLGLFVQTEKAGASGLNARQTAQAYCNIVTSHRHYDRLSYIMTSVDPDKFRTYDHVTSCTIYMQVQNTPASAAFYIVWKMDHKRDSHFYAMNLINPPHAHYWYIESVYTLP